MGLLDKISGLFTCGLVESIAGIAEKYFPPDMNPEQKAAFELELQKLAFEKQKQADAIATEAEKNATERAALLEGTATDLRAIPVLGPILLVLRGIQRPMWGFAIMFADMQWLSGEWGTMTQRQESAMWMINFLVLGFLFGERAVANLLPIWQTMVQKK